MDVVARHADWWNLPVNRIGMLDELKPRSGSTRVSLQQMVALVPDEGSRADVTELTSKRFPGFGDGLVIGNSEELVRHFSAIANGGVDRFYVWFSDFAAEASLRVFGDEVIAAVA